MIHQVCILFFLNPRLKIYLLILEREEGVEGERERESNIDWLPPGGALTRDGTHNLGMYPDLGLNPQPFSVQDDAPTNAATPPGLHPILKYILWSSIRSAETSSPLGIPHKSNVENISTFGGKNLARTSRAVSGNQGHHHYNPSQEQWPQLLGCSLGSYGVPHLNYRMETCS